MNCGPDSGLLQPTIESDGEEAEVISAVKAGKRRASPIEEKPNAIKRVRIETTTRAVAVVRRSPSPLSEPDRNLRDSKSVEIDIGDIVEPDDDDNPDGNQPPRNEEDGEEDEEQEEGDTLVEDE